MASVLLSGYQQGRVLDVIVVAAEVAAMMLRICWNMSKRHRDETPGENGIVSYVENRPTTRKLSL